MIPSVATKLAALLLYIVAWSAISKGESQGFNQRAEVTIDSDGFAHLSNQELDACQLALASLSIEGDSDNPFEGVPFFLHRNGEPKPCGNVTLDIAVVKHVLTARFKDKCNDLDKYDIESFLTELIADQLQSIQCGSTDNETGPDGLFEFCDMGPERTPILYDHHALVPVSSGTLPCRFFTREGVRVNSLDELSVLVNNAKQKARSCDADDNTCDKAALQEVHLYAVPAGRVFMFAPSFVGEVFELSHVELENGLSVSLEVLSLNPRVFGFKNFFSQEEADDLVNRALSETSPTHRLQRSTTGASGEKQVFSRRTSENAFDTDGETAIKLKQRCFTTLGFDDYLESFADGLQVLRYNESKAYIPHMDYLRDPGELDPYNYESWKTGGNRFATILLYLNDMSEHEGGETVFSEAWPPSLPEEKQIPILQAIDELRASGDAKMLEADSWEEEMVATCRTRLAVRPDPSRAVLFYSQHPNGDPDAMSKHGGCPVLKGAKWAANLWVWNAPRVGYVGAPTKPGQSLEERRSKQVFASFRNSGNDPAFRDADLYFDDKFWSKIGHGDPIMPVNTFEGHVWHVKVGDEILKTYVISDEDEQLYVI